MHQAESMIRLVFRRSSSTYEGVCVCARHGRIRYPAPGVVFRIAVACLLSFSSERERRPLAATFIQSWVLAMHGVSMSAAVRSGPP